MFFEHVSSHSLIRAIVLTATGLLTSHSALAQVPIVQPSQQLRPPIDPEAAGESGTQVQFGFEAATDGQTTIVTVKQGHAAYAYTKNQQGRWKFRDALVAPAGYTSYGAAVLGNVALVQGVVDSQNVVFVFKRTAGQWSYTQTLSGPRPSNRNNVALAPDYAAISDALANEGVGSTFIYDKVGAGTYSFATELVPAGAVEGTLSGHYIENDGDTLLASAPGEIMVTAFVKFGGVWSEQARLTPPRGFDLNPQFSYHADRALLTSVSRTIDSPVEPIVYRRQNGTWSIEQRLVHPTDPNRGLRGPTALKDNLLVVREESGTGQSHLLIYERLGGTWTAKAQLSEPVCSIDLNFDMASEVTIAGRTVFVTCPTAITPRPAFDGRVLVYEIP